MESSLFLILFQTFDTKRTYLFSIFYILIFFVLSTYVTVNPTLFVCIIRCNGVSPNPVPFSFNCLHIQYMTQEFSRNFPLERNMPTIK